MSVLCWLDQLDRYQEQCELLDSHLEPLLNELFGSVLSHLPRHKDDAIPPVLHRLLSVVYSLSKVRGHKAIVSLFPHDVSQLEPVLAALIRQSQSPVAEQSTHWPTAYSLLLWLSILVLNPFDLLSVDSSSSADGGLIGRLTSLGRQYLSDSGPSRPMSAYMLSRVFSRTDMQRHHLTAHIEWCIATLQRATSHESPSSFLLSGALRSLVDICKHGNRDILRAQLPLLAPFCLITLPSIPAMRSSALLRQLNAKLTQRLGLLFLKPRLPTWRYDRGNRPVLDNLSALAHHNTAHKQQDSEQKEQQPEPAAAAAEASPPSASAPGEVVPVELEAVVQCMLDGLCDRDTVVRWSCAKGIGRVTMNLDEQDADDVIAATLDTFTHSSPTDDAAWHGACLAVAELSRRGLLLPSRLAAVLPFTLRALSFDVRASSHSVGSHVRDAACYVIWAFARAYHPTVLKHAAGELATGLLLLAVYDREVNVRRAACAAYQENVGRQGGQSFPHGIEVNTAADYFTVANRQHAYLTVAQHVSQLPFYTFAMIEHLAAVKCRHWDRDVREMACRALADMTRVSTQSAQYLERTVLPSLMAGCYSNDLGERHGCCLAVAELLIALLDCGVQLSAERQASVTSLISAMEDQQLFSTRRSPLLRLALSRLLHSVSLFPLPLSAFPRLFALLEDNLQHLEDEVQQSAAKALSTYWSRNELAEAQLDATLRRWLSDMHTSPLLGARRGFALALSTLPAALLTASPTRLAAVITSLAAGVQPAVQSDAESRRNCLQALVELACRSKGNTHETLLSTVAVQGRSMCAIALSACLVGCRDYATDNRGDVGSWVREAAMRGVGRIVQAVTDVSFDKSLASVLLPTPLLDECVAALLQQAVEKIDRVRECAGQVLQSLVERGSLQSAAHSALLEDTFRAKPRRVDWSVPAETFPTLVPLLSCPAFRPSLLTGLVVSVGGLTESVVRHSTAALSDYLSAADADNCDGAAIGLVAVLQRFRGQARVVVPCFKTLSTLLDASLLDAVSEQHTSFLSALVERCEREVRGSSNINKLMAAATLLSQLLVFQPADHSTSTRRHIATLLLSLLSHTYPRVRKMAAEGMYGALLQHSDDEALMCSILPADDSGDGEWAESADDLCALLSETVWDGSEVHVRGKVRQIRSRLRIDDTATQAGGSHIAEGGSADDATSTQMADLQYASLVGAAGY